MNEEYTINKNDLNIKNTIKAINEIDKQIEYLEDSYAVRRYFKLIILRNELINKKNNNYKKLKK